MQSHAGSDSATDHGQSIGPRHRMLGRIADFFSPTLEYTKCGARTKQRYCAATGSVHPKTTDKEWSRYAAMEVEYLCPACGEEFWVLEVSPQYPLL